MFGIYLHLFPLINKTGFNDMKIKHCCIIRKYTRDFTAVCYLDFHQVLLFFVTFCITYGYCRTFGETACPVLSEIIAHYSRMLEV